MPKNFLLSFGALLALVAALGVSVAAPSGSSGLGDAGIQPNSCAPTNPNCGETFCDPGQHVACALGNGCMGSKTCNAVGTAFGLCGCAGGGAVHAGTACTGCGGRAGTATACNSSCQVSRCNVGPETCNGCDDDGDGVVDNAPGNTQASSLVLSCTVSDNSCAVHGSRACTAGTWTSCQGCSGAFSNCSNGNVCGTVGTGQCTASCTLQTGTCVVGAAQTNCDDDLNGIIDDGVNGSPCGL
jgi:hypothetical protein